MDNDLDTLLTALYVFCDDHVIGPRRVGRPPWLTDAELLCLAIAQVLLNFPNERQWVRYARKNLRALFPYIPDQSGYNKRLRAAGPMISKVIRALARTTPTSAPILRLVDSTPVPCGASRETAQRSDLAGPDARGRLRLLRQPLPLLLGHAPVPGHHGRGHAADVVSGPPQA